MKIIAYRIRVQGQITQQMVEWLEDLTIESETSSDSTLIISSGDQAFLFGVLLRIRDLGIRLLSVNPVEEKR